MEQYIRISQLDGVAELQYKYTSISTNPVFNPSDYDNVRCCLAAPPICLYKAPIDLKCTLNSKKVVMGRALTLTYTVTNKMPYPDKVCISLDCKETKCLVAGELVSTVELMPGADYTFKYNVIPL